MGSDESSAASAASEAAGGGSSGAGTSSLSDAQVQAAVAVSIPTAILSIIGSCMIIRLVVQSAYRKQQRLDTYKRILFAMSIFDLILSSNAALQYFLLPRADDSSSSTSGNSLGMMMPLGNQTTCTVSAMLLQLSMGALLYYGMLSWYFLLTIRYGVSPYKMARRFEPWMHFLAICFPLATSITGLALNLFGDSPSGCWVTMPPDCAANELSLRCNPNLIATIFGLLPGMAVPVVIIVNNALIFYTVHSTLKRTNHRTFAAASMAVILASSSPPPSADTDAVVASSSTALQPEHQQQITPSDDPANNTGSSMFLSSHYYPKSTSFQTGTAVAATGDSRRQQQQHVNKAQAVATQCSLYVAVFFLTYSWSIGIAIMGMIGTTPYYTLVLLERIFLPMSGFWNLFVYIRPRYMTCRQQFPHETKWWATRRAYFGADSIQPTPATAAAATAAAAGGTASASSAAMTTTAACCTQQNRVNNNNNGGGI